MLEPNRCQHHHDCRDHQRYQNTLTSSQLDPYSRMETHLNQYGTDAQANQNKDHYPKGVRS